MARSVTGLFATEAQVESAYGALRDAGFAAARITLVGPAGQLVQYPGTAQEGQGIGAWLVEHLMHHGHPQAQAQEYHDSIAHEGRWLVSVAINREEEDADARNVMVTAGVQEISGVADGTLVTVIPPEK